MVNPCANLSGGMSPSKKSPKKSPRKSRSIARRLRGGSGHGGGHGGGGGGGVDPRVNRLKARRMRLYTDLLAQMRMAFEAIDKAEVLGMDKIDLGDDSGGLNFLPDHVLHKLYDLKSSLDPDDRGESNLYFEVVAASGADRPILIAAE
jgi:hypothetical protein